MKTFLDICKMTQKELKSYLTNYLRSKGYKPVVEDGYIYAAPRENKTEIPVLLIAHMDTVHKTTIKEVSIVPYTVGKNVETRISSPQAIGGDDRCGIWAIMNLINENNCHILFVEDEEIGGIGSGKFSRTDLCKEVGKRINYMIEIDRKGNNDAVFYSCDNKDFIEWITTNTKFKKAEGSYTDIETLMPVMEIAGVNFSSGYYNAHTTNEYVVEEELKEIIDRIGDLLVVQIPQKFKYVKKTYTYGGYDYWKSGSSYRQSSFFDDYDRDYTTPKTTTSKKKSKKFDDMTEIKLTAYSSMYEMEFGIPSMEVVGNTKSECWLNLFMEYEDLSFSMIDDYFWE